MIASLPMYDTPATATANDRFWQAIRMAYGRGPAELDRTEDPHRTWEDPALVLSQTCGLPYRAGLHLKVQLVGTPDYGVEDCPPGYYCSCVIVRRDDPRENLREFANARLARNDLRSQSGWAAIDAQVQLISPDFHFHPDVLDTGSHAASMAAVAGGTADIAAIDAVTWALLSSADTSASQLRVLCRTAPTPGLPFISGPQEDAEALLQAVSTAITQLHPQDRTALGLKGVVKIPPERYLAEPLPRV